MIRDILIIEEFDFKMRRNHPVCFLTSLFSGCLVSVGRRGIKILIMNWKLIIKFKGTMGSLCAPPYPKKKTLRKHFKDDTASFPVACSYTSRHLRAQTQETGTKVTPTASEMFQRSPIDFFEKRVHCWGIVADMNWSQMSWSWRRPKGWIVI